MTANTTATANTTVPLTHTQQINDMDHLERAYPRDLNDSPTQDALRFVGYAKARVTGFKPDPDADPKLATLMPWLGGGLVTDT